MYNNIYTLTYQIACKVCRNNKIKDLLPGLYADYQQVSKAITAPAQIEQAIKQTVKDLNFNYLKQYHDKKHTPLNYGLLKRSNLILAIC